MPPSSVSNEQVQFNKNNLLWHTLSKLQCGGNHFLSTQTLINKSNVNFTPPNKMILYFMLSVSKDLVLCLCGRKSNPIRHFNTHCLTPSSQTKTLLPFSLLLFKFTSFFPPISCTLSFSIPVSRKEKTLVIACFQIWWSIIHPLSFHHQNFFLLLLPQMHCHSSYASWQLDCKGKIKLHHLLVFNSTQHLSQFLPVYIH